MGLPPAAEPAATSSSETGSATNNGGGVLSPPPSGRTTTKKGQKTVGGFGVTAPKMSAPPVGDHNGKSEKAPSMATATKRPEPVEGWVEG